MTDKQVTDVLLHALSAVLNCEGVAKQGAESRREFAKKHALGSQGQDCSEFDQVRRAIAFAAERGINVDAAWARADRIDY